MLQGKRCRKSKVEEIISHLVIPLSSVSLLSVLVRLLKCYSMSIPEMFQAQSFDWSSISNEFFVVKLEFLLRLVSYCEYNFEGHSCPHIIRLRLDLVSFQQCPDASSYFCREISKFIHCLCFCYYISDSVLLENCWFLLLELNHSDGNLMAEDEFLVPLKLTNKRL